MSFVVFQNGDTMFKKTLDSLDRLVELALSNQCQEFQTKGTTGGQIHDDSPLGKAVGFLTLTKVVFSSKPALRSAACSESMFGSEIQLSVNTCCGPTEPTGYGFKCYDRNWNGRLFGISVEN